MNTNTTYAPVPSAAPAPKRATDVFDFIHEPSAPVLTPDDRITVEEADTPETLAVTIEKSDGRSMKRKVPADSWNKSSYRSSLIRTMCMLMA